MRPLEVRFKLTSPVTRPKHPIHLDAALVYASIFEGMPEHEAFELLNAAIVSQGEGAKHVYCASAIFFDPQHHFTRFATRRFDLNELTRDIASGVTSTKSTTAVNLSSGAVRGRLDSIPMMWASTARAWLLCKNEDALANLLGNIRYIGKHSRLGAGRIDGVPDVFESDEAGAWMRRVLPFPVEGAAPIQATVRPPYWDKSTIQKAFLPPALLSGEFGSFA